jgi:peptide/nickel transport system substrate-binding protein/oligopeptide transport system substrate-binding protein
MAFALVGCERPAEPEAERAAEPAPAREVYRLPLNSNPNTLDPARITAVVEDSVARRIFNGLVDLDANLLPEPDLAELWTVSEDGRTYTFFLRRGVTFHNGREMTSADVRYSFERLLRPETASQRAWVVADIVGAAALQAGQRETLEGLQTPDDHTVTITLEKPFPPFLSYLAMINAAVVPREEVEREEGATPFGRAPVGTGPFAFGEWEDNSYISLPRYDDYFQGSAKLKGVRFRVIKEYDVAFQEYRAGNLEHCRVPPAYTPNDIRNLPEKDEMVAAPSLSTFYLGLTMDKTPLGDNVHLRRALNYAVDRRYLCEEVLGGSYVPAGGILPPGLPSYDPGLDGYAYDLEKAKAEMAAAGYGPDNPPPTIALYHNSSGDSPKVVQVLQQDFAAIGVTVELKPMDFGALLASTKTGEPPMFHLGWVADYPDADNFLMLFHSKNIGPPGNRARYSNPQVDESLEKVRRLADPEARMALNRAIEKRILEDAPWVVINHLQTRLFVKPYVKGFVLTGMDSGAEVSRLDFHAVELGPPQP